MKSVDNVNVTFVNTVLGRGILNNVVNIQLGVFQFTPDDKGEMVEPDLVTACRLRMDKICAKQLHETLGELLEIIARAESANGIASEPVTEVTEPPSKPN